MNPQEVVGEAGNEDSFDATLLMDRIGKESPKLAELLAAAGLVEAGEVYTQYDSSAAKAHRKFRLAATRANVAVLLTTLFASLALMMANLATGWQAKADAATAENKHEATRQAKTAQAAYITLSLLSLAAGAFGTAYLSRIQNGGLLTRWMEARAKAEQHRLEYFKSLINVQETDVVLSQWQLEYFRRDQLDVQRNYFRIRGDAHTTSADRILNISTMAVGIAAFTAAASVMLANAYGFSWASLAGVGTIAVAVSAYATTQEGINQNRRNAERYRQSEEILTLLRIRLHSVRAAVAAGNRAVLLEFVNAVHEQLSLENRQWLESAERERTILAGLETALQKAREQSHTAHKKDEDIVEPASP